MKSLFESYVSTLVFIIIIFAISAFSFLELQIMSARTIHNSAINQIQSSYYTVDINAINNKIKEVYTDGSWYVETQTLDSVNGRQDVLVTMHYKVILPLFGVEKSGVIEGYAR